MKTTITVEIKPTPGLFQVTTPGTTDRHQIVVTRPHRTQAIAAMIAELIKVGGPELRSHFWTAQALLSRLFKDVPDEADQGTVENPYVRPH